MPFSVYKANTAQALLRLQLDQLHRRSDGGHLFGCLQLVSGCKAEAGCVPRRSSDSSWTSCGEGEGSSLLGNCGLCPRLMTLQPVRDSGQHSASQLLTPSVSTATSTVRTNHSARQPLTSNMSTGQQTPTCLCPAQTPNSHQHGMSQPATHIQGILHVQLKGRLQLLQVLGQLRVLRAAGVGGGGLGVGASSKSAQEAWSWRQGVGVRRLGTAAQQPQRRQRLAAAAAAAAAQRQAISESQLCRVRPARHLPRWFTAAACPAPPARPSGAALQAHLHVDVAREAIRHTQHRYQWIALAPH